MAQTREGICPECQSELEHGSLDVEEDGVFYPVTCCKDTCSFSGKEYHSLSFEAIYDDDGNEMSE